MTTQPQPLAAVTSIKLKLGLLVGVSVAVATVVATIGRAGGVPFWLGFPVTVGLALAVTQLLAIGMTSPLREMTAAARRMATGDYSVRVTATSSDEVGQLARAFNMMAGDLADVDRQRRDLVAGVSHELRTPLTGLRAVLENIVDGVDGGGSEGATAALDQAERMSRLVEDLLDLARVDAGRAPLEPQPVELATLLDEAVAEARLLPRPVTYVVRVAPDDLVVHADPARLRQLVANLLDNASRHSPADGTVEITAARQDTDGYRLVVRDHGPGVPTDERDRVFEPFRSVRASDGGGGTGLGLAIARWVTDLHGGTIRFVDPEPDAGGTGGAAVHVELPLQPHVRPIRPTQQIDQTIDQEESMPTTAPPPSPEPAVHPPSLLDDVFGSFWPDRGTPARLAALLGAAAVGILAAVVLPFRDPGVGTTLVLLAAGGVVLAASRQRRERFTIACAGLCSLLALVPVVRDAEWLVALSLLTGGLLCVCGVVGGRTASGFLVSLLSWPLAGLRGLPWLGRTFTVLTGLGNGPALLRTTVWSLLGLVVFGALLGSADAIMGEWVSALLPELRVDTFVLRGFVFVAAGGAVLAAAYVALNPPRADLLPDAGRPVARAFEWLVPVLVVNTVFATFLLAQATVVFGGHDYLQRTTGLTYAEYVHQGFGQLTLATALTLLVVWAAARKAPRETDRDRTLLRAALGLLCLQTLVVVASALHRMDLYQEAYGFTALRLLVITFEGWLGLLVLAVLAGGVALRARWLPRFALLTGAVALLGIAAINPEAWVAERNLDRYAATGNVDTFYLMDLSADAVGMLADAPDVVRDCALMGRSDADDDWLEWNLGRSRAAEHLTEDPWPGEGILCPDPS